MDEGTTVAEVALDDDLVAEMDLDVDDGPASGGDEVEPARPWRARWRAARPVAAIAVAAGLLGGGLVHVVESGRERGESVVSVALGEAGGVVLTRRFGNLRVIRLATVALNEGASVVTVRGVRVEGDGAGLTRTFRGAQSIYPLSINPGETGNLPLALTADCRVRASRAPRLLVDVTAEDGAQRTLDVRVPGLDELWRRATAEEACSETDDASPRGAYQTTGFGGMAPGYHTPDTHG